MPHELNELAINEVSLVDHPACSSPDETGRKVPRARVALFKRDTVDTVDFTKDELDELLKAVTGRTQGGVTYPASDYAYAPDKDHPTTWKLRLTKTPGGKPDAGIVGAAIAALGKGFRGNRVVIPSSDLPAVKARVKAAWKQANPDKSDEDMPTILKGEQMTLQEIEAQVRKQDGVLATLVAENKVLKAERELVLKMTKKERKAYASMSPEKQKEFMVGDETKRKSMCDAAMKEMKEKAAEDCMDDALKAQYVKAGPAEKAIMIGKQLEKMKADDAEGGSNEDEMDKKKKSRKEKDDLMMRDKRKAKSEDDDDDDDEDDEDDKKNPDDDDEEEDLQLRKQLARTQDRVVKAEAQLSEITKREKLNHFKNLAEARLPNTAGSPIEKGADLMSVADLCGGEDSDVFKRFLANLETADKAMLIHFGEVGKAGAGVIPAEKVMMAKVEEIAKRDGISVGKATEKVMIEHPELYMAYEQDHRRAIGARS